jgi:hypothetical protein
MLDVKHIICISICTSTNQKSIENYLISTELCIFIVFYLIYILLQKEPDYSIGSNLVTKKINRYKRYFFLY